MRFNSEWLEPLGSFGWVRLAAKYNVAQMLERREFRTRYESGKPIAVHEFLYPLAQAYDSVFLEADVELGGTDQLFNLNVGRDIMPAFGLEAQVVMTTPLLEGLDGVEKMSKSLGNYVGVTDEPSEMFGKVMSVSDDLMWKYYTLLTDLGPVEISTLRSRVASGEVHPKQAKVDLAKRITADFHGAAAADRAADEFERRFAKKEVTGRFAGRRLPHRGITEDSGEAAGRSRLRRVCERSRTKDQTGRRQVERAAFHHRALARNRARGDCGGGWAEGVSPSSSASGLVHPSPRAPEPRAPSYPVNRHLNSV